MATYIVKPAQNLFDVALHLYGSVEGLYDLLITNEWLTMTTQLEAGMELEYHDYFVINEAVTKQFEKDNIVPANSERHVYYKHTDKPLRFVVHANHQLAYLSMEVSGEGEMIIDWGDNSELETVTLSHAVQTVEHYLDSEVEKRRVKVYGDFQLVGFDGSGLGGNFYLMRPMTVDEFSSTANGYSLQSLFLFEGTYQVVLRNCTVDSLLPIGDMNLQTLDLRGCKFLTDDVVDEYLQYVLYHYGTRRNCVVYLDDMPGKKGVDAMQMILSDEEWNRNGQWKFVIAGKEWRG